MTERREIVLHPWHFVGGVYLAGVVTGVVVNRVVR